MNKTKNSPQPVTATNIDQSIKDIELFHEREPVTAAREVPAGMVYALCESIEKDQDDSEFTRGMRTMARRIRKEVSALAATPAARGQEADVAQALQRIVDAEERFVRDTGLPIDDLVTDAVKHAKQVLANHQFARVIKGPQPPHAEASAIGARHEPNFTTGNVLLDHLLDETFWMGQGPNNHDTVVSWHDALQAFLSTPTSAPVPETTPQEPTAILKSVDGMQEWCLLRELPDGEHKLYALPHGQEVATKGEAP